MSFLRMIAVAAALTPVIAEAHPGAHPYGLAESLAHIATQSDHLLALAVACGWISIVAMGALGVAYASRKVLRADD
jgi:hydrogenase/urease accessory protein HupE